MNELPKVDFTKGSVELPPFDQAILTDLTNSLAAAHQLAMNGDPGRNIAPLDPGLLNALVWPQTIDNYSDYLGNFATWRPIEEPESYWSNHLKGPAKGSQEIYDRLCHFYFLIDQPLPDAQSVPAGQTLQQNPTFNAFIDDFAKRWGSFLSTSASFDMSEVEDFNQNSPLYDVIDSMTESSNTHPPFHPIGGDWETFNQFFARELRPGLRPIAEPPGDEVFITRPADCTYEAQYKIDANGGFGNITIKGTHTYATVGELLNDDAYNQTFANGTFIHYFLAPYSYHRFHAPVTGSIKDFGVEQGLAYLAVQLSGGQFDAPDSSTDGYEVQQTRGFVVIDTSENNGPNIGLVAAAPIGMAQVSSVILEDANGNALSLNDEIAQGDQFGYFYFGGSDIIILLQDQSTSGYELSINEKINYPAAYVPDYYHYGTEIVSLTPSSS